jgi:uncharacterized protein with HEPN domain
MSHAQFTTQKCLANKLVARGRFLECVLAGQAKVIREMQANLPRCFQQFYPKLEKLDVKGARGGVACRYLDLDNGTVVDLDTGLQWEKKDSADGVISYENPHDADNTYSWGQSGCPVEGCRNGTVFTDFLSRLNASESCFGGGCDWRLPEPHELEAIVDFGAPGCAAGGTCIDPAFGAAPEESLRYISNRCSPPYVNLVDFADGERTNALEFEGEHVRAVRRLYPGLGSN